MALFSQLGKYRNTGILIMRAGIGIMMILHGLPKITNPDSWAKLGTAMGGLGIHFAPAFWGFMAALTETVGGLFTVLGLWFRLVCMFMIVTMLVAILHHINAGDSIKDAAEAVELLAVYVGLLFVGAGKYSVDGN